MTAFHEDRARADSAFQQLRAFSQPQRLMILSCLLHGEYTVSEIDKLTRIGQPALSQQLAELRRAKLVLTRKDAKLVYYSLADDETALRVRTLLAIIDVEGDSAQKLSQLLQGLHPKSELRSIAAGAAGFARVE